MSPSQLASWGSTDGALVAVQGAGVALSGRGLVSPGNCAVPLHALRGQPQQVVAALVRVRLPEHPSRLVGSWLAAGLRMHASLALCWRSAARKLC